MESNTFTLPTQSTLSYYRWLYTTNDSLFHESPASLKYALDLFDSAGVFVSRLDSIVLNDTLTTVTPSMRDIVINRNTSVTGTLRFRRVSNGLMSNDAKWRKLITRQRLSGESGAKRGRRVASNSDLKIVVSPNPFKFATEISFEVPSPGLVSLEVFDVLGRRVEQVVDKEFRAGRHRIGWQASALPNGAYVLKLRQGTKLMTTNVVLLK
jgi:hypothetical protein